MIPIPIPIPEHYNQAIELALGIVKAEAASIAILEEETYITSQEITKLDNSIYVTSVLANGTTLLTTCSIAHRSSFYTFSKPQTHRS